MNDRKLLRAADRYALIWKQTEFDPVKGQKSPYFINQLAKRSSTGPKKQIRIVPPLIGSSYTHALLHSWSLIHSVIPSGQTGESFNINARRLRIYHPWVECNIRNSTTDTT